MKNSKEQKFELEYGPVVVSGFFPEDRICFYDDEELKKAICYPGDMGLTMDLGYYRIPFKCLRPVTTDDLWRRRESLMRVVGKQHSHKPNRLSWEERYRLLVELEFVEGILSGRMFEARFPQSERIKTIFISHSSRDKQFATWLSVDLANSGHTPWLDEWDIKAGESIPKSISQGIQKADFVIVILTENSVVSGWVEHEWHEKYWDEVSDGDIRVIPVLLRDCDIPVFLRTKKYADFRESYADGFGALLKAIGGSVVQQK